MDIVIQGGQGGKVLAQFDFDMELAECLNQYWVIATVYGQWQCDNTDYCL